MTEEKKPSTDELYAQRQWSDNLSFSNKAMDESKKKTGQMEKSPPAKPAEPVRMSRNSARAGQLDQYVNDMNREINRMSDAVGERMDHVGNRLSHSVKRMVKPVGNTVNEVAETAASSIKAMGTGIGKAMLTEFTSVIRNLGDKVSVNKRPPGPPVEIVAELPEENEVAPALGVRSFSSHFGNLLENKIFFSTIHGRPFLTERDIEVFHPADAQQAYEWMTRGLDEIRNCAPYGQKLPTPKKGPFMNIPMYDVLRQISYEDLEAFLHFVLNRPQPFQQKALKLSEAFATWVHKGAPER
ncbi:MAG: hypothetical protein ACAI44_04860 [Candidatus Sericytochromatia bacterium]